LLFGMGFKKRRIEASQKNKNLLRLKMKGSNKKP